MNFDPSLVAIVKAAAAGQNVPVDLALGVAQQESQFNASALSPAGAVGLMQILPTTADWLLKRPNGTTTVQELMDPSFNAYVGALFLSYLMNRYAGDAQKVAAAYNWGPGNIPPSAPFDETGMPSETKNYWRKVLNYAQAWAGKVSQVEATVANAAQDVASAFEDQASALGWTSGGRAVSMIAIIAAIGGVLFLIMKKR